MRLKTICYIILAIGLFACSTQNTKEQPETIEALADEEPIPDQESWQARIVLSDSGITYAIINAGHIVKFSSENRIQMDEGVHVDFYNRRSGKHSSVLTSERGEIEEKKNNLKALENVVVISDSGITLETEELEWDNRRQKIISDVDVKITTHQDVIYGKGFFSNPELTEWEIMKASGYTKRNVQENKKTQKQEEQGTIVKTFNEIPDSLKRKNEDIY